MSESESDTVDKIVSFSHISQFLNDFFLNSILKYVIIFQTVGAASDFFFRSEGTLPSRLLP